ncbi:MAG: M15 family metallopeptidase [Patescibacteria group bacterium]
MSIYQNPNLRNRRILGYEDVAAVPPGTRDEPLVDVREYSPDIVAEYAKPDMKHLTGETIYVRDMLAEKLAKVNRELGRSSMRLLVTYGYRHPEVQRAYFEVRREEIAQYNPLMIGEELDAYTHNFVAIPSLGGHPAAAAVDLTILDRDNIPLDMGTGIADYTDPEKIRTDHPGLTYRQIGNRAILHDAMVDENFAPFYGEWWHFSYGDREWGAFYDTPALYDQVDFRPGAQ